MLDRSDRSLLQALESNPRSSVALLAEQVGLARGTVQHRLREFLGIRDLRLNSTRVRASAIGLPLRAVVTATILQSDRDQTMAGLAAIPEVVECLGVTGAYDLLCHVVARDTEHLQEISNSIRAIPGIQRTSTSVVLEEALEYRMAQLL
jgi:DNA-binding Lrp family transcriptional regulator